MNNIDYGLTAENMLRTLPVALQNDSKMVALAKSIADVLEQRTEEISLLQIYNRIDELPAEMLDILARDFKIDWYDYDYNLAAKRRIIKCSFYVHRHLGTYGAVKTAICALYPDSRIEEWYEYGGEPYSFRVILNMSVPFVVPLDAERVLWAVSFYKSLRSHADGIYYQSAFRFGIMCKSGYVVYGVRICGTYPTIATQGGICEDNVTIITDRWGGAYTHPETGTLNTGTFPTVATQGVHAGADIGVATASKGAGYSPTRLTGEYPTAATQGVMLADGIAIAYAPDGTAYATPDTGTLDAGLHPEAATQGGVENHGIAAEANGLGVAYNAKLCGSTPGSIL